MLPPLPRMKVFKASGENAAAVALLMLRAVAAEEPLTTYTWLGVEIVSEKTAALPFCETAMTLPVTRPRGVPGAGKEVNGLVELPKLAGVMATAPNSLPM